MARRAAALLRFDSRFHLARFASLACSLLATRAPAAFVFPPSPTLSSLPPSYPPFTFTGGRRRPPPPLASPSRFASSPAFRSSLFFSLLFSSTQNSLRDSRGEFAASRARIHLAWRGGVLVWWRRRGGTARIPAPLTRRNATRPAPSNQQDRVVVVTVLPNGWLHPCIEEKEVVKVPEA